MDFTKPIQKRLDRKGWNHSELARQAGLSKGGLCDFFKGRESVSFPRLIRIAEALNVSVWRLVREAEKGE